MSASETASTYTATVTIPSDANISPDTSTNMVSTSNRKRDYSYRKKSNRNPPNFSVSSGNPPTSTTDSVAPENSSTPAPTRPPVVRPESTRLFRAATVGNLPEVMRLLSETGISGIFKHDVSGNSPFQIAVRQGHLEVVKAILAACNEKDKDKCIRTWNKHQRTPLFLAVNEGHREIVEYLLANGASASVNKTDTSANATPLHRAARYESTDILQLLLDHGAHVNATNADGETALYVACDRGKVETARVLLAAGGDPTIITKGGDTAVHACCDKGHYKVVEVLLTYKEKFKWDIPDKHGKTPLMIAPDRRRTRIVRMLDGTSSTSSSTSGAESSGTGKDTTIVTAERVDANMSKNDDTVAPVDPATKF